MKNENDEFMRLIIANNPRSRQKMKQRQTLKRQIYHLTNLDWGDRIHFEGWFTGNFK